MPSTKKCDTKIARYKPVAHIVPVLAEQKNSGTLATKSHYKVKCLSLFFSSAVQLSGKTHPRSNLIPTPVYERNPTQGKINSCEPRKHILMHDTDARYPRDFLHVSLVFVRNSIAKSTATVSSNSSL